VSGGDVLPVKLASPTYVAVIVCDPTGSAEVVYVALPPLSVNVTVVVSTLTVTFPVGTPVVADFTVAVKVTELPCFDGLAEELTVVDVAAFATVWVKAVELLPVKFVAPPYTAVIECDPAPKLDVTNVAAPPLSVLVPNGVPPSSNVTEPVGVPAPGATAVTVALNVTD